MDEQSQRRLARNEALFRDANEGIRRGVWPGEPDRPLQFRCECAAIDCQKSVTLTLPEYESVRAHPARFVVLAGHEISSIEDVVARGDGWSVVEKRGEAGVAEARDPQI